MAITDLSSTQLERLVELIKEKEALLAKIKRIDESVAELVDKQGQKNSTPRSASRMPGCRQRRGKLKAGILKLLDSAGKAGLSVKELAEKLKAKPASVSVWFYTTGKKIKGIRKVGVGRFAYGIL